MTTLTNQQESTEMTKFAIVQFDADENQLSTDFFDINFSCDDLRSITDEDRLKIAQSVALIDGGESESSSYVEQVLIDMKKNEYSTLNQVEFQLEDKSVVNRFGVNRVWLYIQVTKL